MNHFRLLVFMALVLLHPVVAMKQVRKIFEEHRQSQSHSSNDAVRNLQPSAYNYRANYTADFHHLLDPTCAGEEPELIVTCVNADNITILGTSDASIICSREEIDIAGFPNASSYRCRNTCNGTSCNDVYVSADNIGPYGSIQFMCEGDDYQQVEASYVFLGGVNGYCNSTSEKFNRNLHVAKFGISCPSDNNSNGAVREYVYDDTYFECTFTNEQRIFEIPQRSFGSAFDSVGDPFDVYTCLTGNDCANRACSNVMYEDIIIRSAVPKFLLPCVETNLQSITEIPSQSPISQVESVSGINLINVRFEALWGNFYYPNVSSCQRDNTGVMIRCGNGATTIRFHSSTDPSMNCIYVSDIDLHCIGNATKIQSQFVSVFYDCYGGNVSTSIVTFPDTNVSCDKNDENVLLQNSVTMGMACEKLPMFYRYSDLLFECTNPSHQFYVSPSPEYNLIEDRYICSESTLIRNGSSTLNVQIIPSVSITTDSLWLRDAELRDDCSKIVDSIPTPTISIPPSLAPVPNVREPTIPTFDISSPADASLGTKPRYIYAIIGGIGGGIVISMIVLFVYRKGKNDGSSTKKANNVDSTDSHASTDPMSRDHVDQMTQRSNSMTNKQYSTSEAVAIEQRETNTADIDARERLVSTTNEAVNEIYAYDIDYKDQARSVDHRFPVVHSARRIVTTSGDVPVVNVVHVLDDVITNDKERVVPKFRDIPSHNIATLYDV